MLGTSLCAIIRPGVAQRGLQPFMLHLTRRRVLSLEIETFMFQQLQVGDMITYVVAGRASRIKVTGRTAHHVVCGEWKFDVFTGKQLDPTLQPGANDWGVPPAPALGHLVKE